MVLFVLLAFCASLQIGGIYLLVVSIAMILACRIDKEPLPVLPLAVMVLMPMLLTLLVVLALPTAWAGFMENVRQTPFITGFRVPHWQEVAKMIRTVPGILVVTATLPFWWFNRFRSSEPDAVGVRHEILLFAALLPALGLLVASLSIISANTVAISNYLQPMIVAASLALCASLQMEQKWLRWQVAFLVPAIVLGSVRAVGMTTWGLACAADVNYPAAMQRLEQELANHPAQSKIVMSSALLYGASTHKELHLIHSDWMTRAGGDSLVSDSQALLALKPEKLVLTQYDYYRRFEAVLERVKDDPSLKDMQVTNLAHTPTPDSIPALQKVVQHISWAPVIVNLYWR
jgi:hypothetical protein